MKQKFIDAVLKHNLDKVRTMLADELLLDPRGASFSEMLEYAKTNLDDLFEPTKESDYVISSDRNTWNIDVLSKVKQDLLTNFSVEKLALFQEIAMEVGKGKARTLYEEDNKEHENSTSESNGNRTSSHDESLNGSNESNRGDDNLGGKKEMLNKRTLGTISLCGGAALTIIGVCVKGCIAQTLLCLAGGAAVIGGVLLLTKENNK